jgi:uncharacterized protein YukE
MNAAGRKLIAKWAAALDDIKGEIEELASEEREKFDNLSEGLQQAERGQAIEAAADALDTAQSTAEEICDALDELVTKVDQLIDEVSEAEGN